MVGLHVPEPNHPLTAHRRTGVVTDLSNMPFTISCQVGGDTTVDQPCTFVADYHPIIGDTVVILEQGGDYCVLGAINSLAPSGLGFVIYTNALAADSTTTTTTEIKDSGISDCLFTAYYGAYYRVRYQARAFSTLAGTTIDVKIRDSGDGTSPVNTDTILAAGSIYLATGAGAGSSQIIVVSPPLILTAGLHTVNAFFLRTAGTGTVSMSQTTGQVRSLEVDRCA